MHGAVDGVGGLGAGDATGDAARGSPRGRSGAGFVGTEIADIRTYVAGT